MKKILAVLLLGALMMTIGGCGKQAGYELALVTDIGTIDDKSFNQGSWEGVEAYAKENNVTYKYYQPAEKTTDEYLNTISLAIDGGAKLVVCPGYLFEEAVYIAQDEYPETKFIIIDGQPHDGDYEDFTINDNVYAVYYAEEQAGFLAGYGAVKEGYTKLGYMGGMAVPAVKRFGFGFVEGAEYAAKELGIDSIDMKYHYTGGFDATPEVKSMATSWFNEGTEVIFACGGAVGNSVMAAAQDTNAKVIGVDVDQSPESETVMTSAVKMLSKSVYDGIAAHYAGTFPGGQVVTLTAADDGVGLPMETSTFETFTQADYDAIYAELVAGSITLLNDSDIEDETQIPVEIVKVESVN